MDLELVQIIAALLGAGGGLALLIQTARELAKWASGREGRARVRRKSIEQERDDADAYRRVIAEYASLLIRMLHEAGITAPPWPKNPNEPPEKETS